MAVKNIADAKPKKKKLRKVHYLWILLAVMGFMVLFGKISSNYVKLGQLDKEIEAIDKSKGRKAARQTKELNEEIEISRFVCQELEKFESGIYKTKYEANLKVYEAGLIGLYEMKKEDIFKELKAAREMPKNTKEAKELRAFAIEIAKNKLSARKAIDKYYKTPESFVQPSFDELDRLFSREDALNEELKGLYEAMATAKKAKDTYAIKDINEKIKADEAEKKDIQKAIKAEMDKHAFFGRAAKPYLDAERIVKEKENTTHFEEIAARYDEAKANEEAALQAQLDEQKKLEAEKAAAKAAFKAEKEAAKASKKNK